MTEKKPSKFVTFILSFIPGVGHLYLGAMSRGLQFMLLFFGALFLTDFLGFSSYFYFWLPIIWFYNLFDALQRADMVALEAEGIDKPLVEWHVLKGKNTIVGWVLIVLGLYFFLDRFIPQMFFQMWRVNLYNYRSILTALILIAAGAYMLRGKRVDKNE